MSKQLITNQLIKSIFQRGSSYLVANKMATNVFAMMMGASRNRSKDAKAPIIPVVAPIKKKRGRPPIIRKAHPVMVAQVLPAVTIAFESWEEINEYFHGKYGFSEVAKKESVPCSSDIYDLHVYYQNANEDDKGVIDFSWYSHSQFKYFQK